MNMSFNQEYGSPIFLYDCLSDALNWTGLPLVLTK